MEMSFQLGRHPGKHIITYRVIHVFCKEVCARCYRRRVGGTFALLGSRESFAEEMAFELGLEERGNSNAA